MKGVLSLRGEGWCVYKSFDKKILDNSIALHYDNITPIKNGNIVRLAVFIDNNEIKDDIEVEYEIITYNSIINGKKFLNKFAKLVKNK